MTRSPVKRRCGGYPGHSCRGDDTDVATPASIAADAELAKFLSSSERHRAMAVLGHSPSHAMSLRAWEGAAQESESGDSDVMFLTLDCSAFAEASGVVGPIMMDRW